MIDPTLLTAVVPHALHTTDSQSLDLAPWQVINLAGCVVLALMFSVPVIDDVKRWRKEMADRR